MRRVTLSLVLLVLLWGRGLAQQGSGQDDKILERGDKLLDEAKLAYEDARTNNAVAAFVDAGFKLEEARIKFIVLQEIGSPEIQKIATDRLRAINQLSKLIHDGKVAISGNPADSPTPKPTDAAPDLPKKDPSAAPAALPEKPPVDVTKRAAVPDAAKQRDAEKNIKDLFKDQYAKKSQADRMALGRLLLEHAAKSQDDPVAQWVLYREAQDAAVQASDIKGVVDAIEAASHFFDVDAMAIKNATFVSMGKTVKTAEESASLAIALLRLVDELAAADLYDSADKATTAALQLSRKSNEPTLALRVTLRAKEITEAKTLYQAMKSSLAMLARTPDDPNANFEMGKFLCFVKGNWDLGARFLVKGSDATLKSLAEKEMTPAMQTAELIALADGWWDLAEKEKSPIRKGQMLAHSRILYESALSDAAALVRVKIDKRLSELNTQKVISSANLLREFEAGKWRNLIPGRGDWVKGKEGYTFKPVAGGGPDFGWTYPLPKGTTSFTVKLVFKVRDVGAIQIVFVEKTDVITGYGVALSYKWSKGLSVGNLGAQMKTVELPTLDKGWHTLAMSVTPLSISAKLDNQSEIQWSGKFEPTSITASGDEFEDWQVSEFGLNLLR